MKDFTDCPKCGKKTLVMRNADVYQCLSCDFKRDFAAKKTPNYDFPALLVIVFITLVVFLTQSEAPAPQAGQQSAPYTINMLQ